MNLKNYNCKNEELPVIAEYLAFSFKRDLANFTAFSPKFNEAFVTAFEGKIAAVTEIVNPGRETVELKIVTDRLYKTMKNLIDPVARVERYVKMAGNEIPVNIKDFGFVKLRQKIKSKDAEGVLAGLKTVIGYIDTYKSALATQGLSDELAAVFASSATSMHNDNQRQYEIVETRKRLVENNLHLFNELYEMIAEICNTGKVIYRGNTIAVKEYTFAELKKRVRIVRKPQVDKASDSEKQS